MDSLIISLSKTQKQKLDDFPYLTEFIQNLVFSFLDGFDVDSLTLNTSKTIENKDAIIKYLEEQLVSKTRSKEFETRISEILSEKMELESRIRFLESTMENQKTFIRQDLIKELSSDYESIKLKCSELEKENIRLESQIYRTESTLKYETEKRMNELRIMKDKEIEELKGQINKNKVSIRKGQSMESDMLTILQSIFESANIEHISHIAHKGDIHVSDLSEFPKHIKFMIDTKDYTNVLPKAQVEKFLDDMDRNNDITHGILISTNEIVGVKEIDIRFTPINGKPVIFLPCFNDISDKQETLKTMFYLLAKLSAKDMSLDINSLVLEANFYLGTLKETYKLFKKNMDEIGKKMNSDIIRFKEYFLVLLEKKPEKPIEEKLEEKSEDKEILIDPLDEEIRVEDSEKPKEIKKRGRPIKNKKEG